MYKCSFNNKDFYLLKDKSKIILDDKEFYKIDEKTYKNEQNTIVFQTRVEDFIIGSVKTYLIVTEVSYPYGGGESFMYQTMDWMEGWKKVWLSFRDIKTGGYKKTEIILEGDKIFHHSHHQKDLQKIIQSYNPDVIHTQGGIAGDVFKINEKLNIPILVGHHFWCNLFMTDTNIDMMNHLQKTKGIFNKMKESQLVHHYVASDFMNKILKKNGHPPLDVLYPLPDPSQYLVLEKNKTEKFVTMVNLSPFKGGDLFLKIVEKLPDIPFLAMNNDPGGEKNVEKLKKFNNVTILGYSDMKEIYSKTHIMLVPSMVDETFCRVAFEAADNSIPVVTSGSGYISEMLGDSGIYPGDWVSEIRRLWVDEEYHEEYSIKVKENLKKFSNNKENFIQKINHLRDLSPKNNIMIFTTWGIQGLAYHSEVYADILLRGGYNVHIFSFHPYHLKRTISYDKLNSSQKYTSIYFSYNDREKITETELKNFIVSKNIGTFIIIETCFRPNFEKVQFVKKLGVKTIAIPNSETVRSDELGFHNNFNKILCSTRQCESIFSRFKSSTYIGHPLYYRYGENILEDKVMFVHISGYNGETRKNTSKILKAFKNLKMKNYQLDVFYHSKEGLNANYDSYSDDNIKVHYGMLTREEVLDKYLNANISVQVSSHEGLGLGFYESIERGRPVVSINIPPHNEIVKDGITGWLVNCPKKKLTDNNKSLVEGGLLIESKLTEKVDMILKDMEGIRSVIEKTKDYAMNFNNDIYESNFLSNF